MAGLHPALDFGAQGSVVVAAVGSVLEELAARDPLEKSLLFQEVVIDPVLFARPRPPGCRRRRKLELRDPVPE